MLNIEYIINLNDNIINFIKNICYRVKKNFKNLNLIY